MREPVPASFILFASLPEAEIYYQPENAIALVLTKVNFIPMKNFQNIFNKVTELAGERKITRVLFDKRSLTIFHQPSMEWYYLEWKNYMMEEHGLHEHGKLLPKDDLFRISVQQAREKIFANNPQHRVNHIKLLYFESLEEAVQHNFSGSPRNK